MSLHISQSGVAGDEERLLHVAQLPGPVPAPPSDPPGGSTDELGLAKMVLVTSLQLFIGPRPEIVNLRVLLLNPSLTTVAVCWLFKFVVTSVVISEQRCWVGSTVVASNCGFSHCVLVLGSAERSDWQHWSRSWSCKNGHAETAG